MVCQPSQHRLTVCLQRRKTQTSGEETERVRGAGVLAKWHHRKITLYTLHRWTLVQSKSGNLSFLLYAYLIVLYVQTVTQASVVNNHCLCVGMYILVLDIVSYLNHSVFSWHTDRHHAENKQSLELCKPFAACELKKSCYIVTAVGTTETHKATGWKCDFSTSFKILKDFTFKQKNIIATHSVRRMK